MPGDVRVADVLVSGVTFVQMTKPGFLAALVIGGMHVLGVAG